MRHWLLMESHFLRHTLPRPCSASHRPLIVHKYLTQLMESKQHLQSPDRQAGCIISSNRWGGLASATSEWGEVGREVTVAGVRI